MKEITANFNIENYFAIKTDSVDLGRAIIRVNHNLIEEDARATFNNQLVKVEYTSAHKSKRKHKPKIKGAEGTAYGILKFSSNLKTTDIALSTEMSDYLLIESRSKSAELKITPASKKDMTAFFAQHPDPAIRMADRLSQRRQRAAAVLGFLLGIAGAYSVRSLDTAFAWIASVSATLTG